MIANDILRQWTLARNEAAEADIYGTDERFALAAGLPTLSALNVLAARLEAGGPYLGKAEMLDEVRRILVVARTEGQIRAERAGVAGDIPGLQSTFRYGGNVL